jgi:hypothetical protein
VGDARTVSRGPSRLIRRLRSLAALLSGLSGAVPVCSSSAQPSGPQSIPDRSEESVQVELRELFRVGSLDGANDSFGRVMSAALSPSGRLFVADDQQRTVLVFDARGRFVTKLGRQGFGPGEFQQPWLVAVDSYDTLFVWDAGQARVSVFGPALQYVRSFGMPASWSMNSMALLSIRGDPDCRAQRSRSDGSAGHPSDRCPTSLICRCTAARQSGWV